MLAGSAESHAPCTTLREVGGIGPQGSRRIRRRLVGLGFRRRQGGARRGRLLALGQAGELAGTGGAEGISLGATKARIITRGKGSYRVLYAIEFART